MADPRGLSGAVFQPTQLRDFTKDLLVSNQYKAKKEAAAQKQDEDYYSQFKTGDIKNQSHRDFYQSRILQPLKEQQIQVAELRMSKPNSPEYKAAKSRLENMSRAAISLPAGLNALDATAASNKNAFDNAYEKGWVTEDAAANVDAYGRFVDGIDANYEGSYFDEKGNLIVEGQYYTQSLRPQDMRFNEPYDLRSDLVEYYSVKKRDGIIDKNDILKELNRARGSERQQKQFYNYLKEQKGYDEDRIQSAIQADSENLVKEFYDYAIGELVSTKDENTKTESGNDGKGWSIDDDITALGVAPIEVGDNVEGISINNAFIKSDTGQYLISGLSIDEYGKIKGAGYKGEALERIIAAGGLERLNTKEIIELSKGTDYFENELLTPNELASLNAFITAKTKRRYNNSELKKLIKEFTGSNVNQQSVNTTTPESTVKKGELD